MSETFIPEQGGSRADFVPQFEVLYKKGLGDIARRLEMMSYEKLKILDRSMSDRGYSIGSIGILESNSERRADITALVGQLDSLAHTEKQEQEKICQEIARIIDEI